MSPVNNQGQETKEILIQTWFKARLILGKDIWRILHLTCACAILLYVQWVPHECVCSDQLTMPWSLLNFPGSQFLQGCATNKFWLRSYYISICKQLLDEIFVISAMTKGGVSVITQGCMPSVITCTYQDIDYSGYHKTKFNNIVLLYIVLKKITTNIHHMEHSLQYFP